MTLICGMTPEARVLRWKMPPYPARAETPSWMRAPAPSLRETSGAPAAMAMSMILWILVAWASPRAPPKIRKSCA